MKESDFSVEIGFSESGELSQISSLLNKEPFGPKLSFYEDGTLEAVLIEYYNRPVGTNQAWIDNGQKAWECYSSPNLYGATIYRDFSIEFLRLEDLQPSLRRWRACKEEFFDCARTSEIQGLTLLFDANAELELPPIALNAEQQDAIWLGGRSISGGAIGTDIDRDCATVTFWPNGAVRTVGYWEDDAVIGTRSCFTSEGRLLVEQFFHTSGYRNGNWVNRFFSWHEGAPRLGAIEMYLDFKLHKAIEEPVITSILNEASLNRYVDPLLGQIRELSTVNNTESRELVDWTLFEM